MVALAAMCAPAAALSWFVGGYWNLMRHADWRRAVQRALVPVTVGLTLAGGYVLATPGDWIGVAR